jgi:hypothetical protein
MSSFAWLFWSVPADTIGHSTFVNDYDILINVDLLRSFMRELSRMFDSLHETVVRGDCIINSPIDRDVAASGMTLILTRRAARVLLFSVLHLFDTIFPGLTLGFLPDFLIAPIQQ